MNLVAARQAARSTERVNTDGERRLWQAVLLQTVADAAALDAWEPGPPPNRADDRAVAQHKARCDTRRRNEREQMSARQFLIDGGRGFVRLCHFAGLDPQSTAEHMRRLAARGWPVPQ